MIFKLRTILVICVPFLSGSLLLSDVPDKLPPRVAPIYGLPKDGTWVDFDITYRDRRNQLFLGKMRISSVGQKQLGQKGQGRWIEVKIQGKPFEVRLGKLLVAEEIFAQKQSLEEAVLEAYHREGSDGAVVRLTGDQIADYFTMGIRGELDFVKNEEIKTKLGTFQGKQVFAQGKGRLRPAKKNDNQPGKEEPQQPVVEVRELHYRAWLANEVPFGIARFEVWAKVGTDPTRKVFSAEAISRGDGAKSELNESKSNQP